MAVEEIVGGECDLAGLADCTLACNLGSKVGFHGITIVILLFVHIIVVFVVELSILKVVFFLVIVVLPSSIAGSVGKVVT